MLGVRASIVVAQKLLDMLGLPRPGIRPVFPALTGRFFFFKLIYFLIEG